MEKTVTLANDGQQVVGMLHVPDTADGPVPAVLFFHGFRGTRTEKHCMFVKASRALADRGIASFRFDFRGSGESEGAFSDATPGSELEDARLALHYVSSLPEVDADRVGILAMSFGAVIASLLIAEGVHPKALMLWAPVAHPDALTRVRVTPTAGNQLESLGVADLEAWAVGKCFIEEVVKLKPLEAVTKYRGPVCMLHGTNDEAVPYQESLCYEEALTREGQEVVRRLIEGANHTFDSMAWEREVIELSLDWFCSHLLEIEPIS